MSHQQSITQYYQSVGQHQQSTVDYFQSAVQGLGTIVSTPPIVAASRLIRGQRLRKNGVGAGDSVDIAPDDMAKLAAFGFVFLAISGVLSYQAGKAMAPNPQSRTTWGLIGIPVGMFTGAFGLGTMGIVSNVKKG